MWPLVGRDFYREALEIEEEELLDKILAITHERHLKKKEVLIQAGETQNQIVFLVSGILRGFFLDAEGREVTDCFGLEPGTAAMGGFAFGKPSAITIEALTEAEVVWLPMAEVQELFARYPQLMAVYNRYLLKALNVHWELKTMIGQESAMVRYHWFMKTYPGLVDHVRDKYVASFLGMTPVTLSRLRRKLREGGDEGEQGDGAPSETL